MTKMTTKEAKTKNIYMEITQSDTPDSLLKFLKTYNKNGLFVKTRCNKNFLADMKAMDIDMITIYDADTGEQIYEIISVQDFIYLCLKQPTDTQEISNSVSSIFLDTYNIELYLKDAKVIQQKYGSNKIDDMNITGDEYLKNMETIVQVAHDIINQKLIPDIFDVIPIKKDKTFQANRTIPIFANKLIEATAYDGYVEKHELMLCIVPHDTWVQDKYYDLSEIVSKNRARLCITNMDGAKKITPLIAKDMSINDIKTKASYLKDNDVKTGGIYEDKNGSKYLYLGDIAITSDIGIELDFQNYNYTGHHYIRITKKVQAMIDKTQSLDEFIKLYIEYHVKCIYDNIPLSIRSTPRKFIKEVDTPFTINEFSVTNKIKTSKKKLNYLFSIKATNRDNEMINMNYAIIKN